MKQLSLKAHAAAFYAEFFNESEHPRYVLGINEYTDAILKLRQLNGIVCPQHDQTHYNGTPIVKLQELPAGCMAISVIYNQEPRNALNSLRQRPGVACMDYFAVADGSRGELPQVQALADTRKEYALRQAQFEWLSEQFKDEESQEVYNRVMEFRLNGNLRALNFFECPPLCDQPWKTRGVVAIGFETYSTPEHTLDTLAGLRCTIEEEQPQLAIAVHQHPSLFWKVAQAVLNTHRNYTVSIRHHSEGLWGTVLYFQPHGH